MRQSGELDARRKRLRLTTRDLAKLASLDRTTVQRALRGDGEVLASTILKIEGAIAAEEKRLVGDILLEQARTTVAREARP